MRLVIAIASLHKWNIQQLDIKAAYLNAPLNEEIYMTIPEGDPNYQNGFWKLNKALYGLKQAGRMWNITISNFLKSIGFTQLKSEQCLFSKSNSQKETTCIVALYVDDMLITGLDSEINSTVELIKNKFKISKCSPVNHILGITVEPTEYGYNISQKKYINDILKRFKINENQKSSTPCVGENIKEINNEPFDNSIYQSAVGSLIHLAKCTRPDIACAVNKASRKNKNPNMTDWKKVLQIFKYINQTKDYYLQYKRDGNLNGYTDSDFAGDIINSKSTSGNIYFLASGPVLWMSRQQQCVSRSTAEAEYVALSEAVANGLWLKNILEELFNKKFKINLYGDNKASLYSAENFAIGKRLRHIRVSYHFFKEHVENNNVILQHIKSEDNLADVLTKDVNGNKMLFFANKIFKKNLV